MTSTLTAPPSVPPSGTPPTELGAKRSGRRFRNGLATVLMGLCLVIVLVPLAFVLVTVVQKGISAVTESGWFTDDIPPVRRSGPGMGPAIVGTILTTGLATLMAVPLGILGAVYLQEYGKTGKLASVLRFFADVMTGVPSIIMGLFIFTIWVVRFGVNGVNAFAGALALGCLMLPIVIRSTEEMLKLVPNDLREASLALGSSKSRTIITVVLPAALPGIVSGVLLAVARAAGETAPLLFTAMFSNYWLTRNVMEPTPSLAVLIFNFSSSPFRNQIEIAWSASLVLVFLVLIANIAAQIWTARSHRA